MNAILLIFRARQGGCKEAELIKASLPLTSCLYWFKQFFPPHAYTALPTSFLYYSKLLSPHHAYTGLSCSFHLMFILV